MKRFADDGAIRQAGLEYARLGWKIVLLHPKNKRPIGEAWQVKATDDEESLSDQFDKWPDANIGLLLGPASGVIDIEFDDDQGRLTAEQLFHDCFTPTYKSSRSTHRLFRWSGDLPDVQKVLIEGLEVRIGGGDKAAQSVLPPSRHPTGSHYVWMQGLSPGEVELADVPEVVAAKLANFRAADVSITGSTGLSRAREVLSMASIPEGERNDRLFRFACLTANGLDFDSPTSAAELLVIVEAVNQTKCHPALPASELRQIVTSAMSCARRGRVDESKHRTLGFTEYGLRFDEESDEWFPGDWQLTVINSDPKCYRLHVPAFELDTHDKKGEITLAVEQYRTADRVADAVQAATGTVVLDKRPGEWPAIWNGAKRKGRPASEGIKSKLLATARYEDPPAVDKRFVTVAEILAEKISHAMEGEVPDGIGMPVRIRDGHGLTPGVWFGWKRLWRDAMAFGDVEPRDLKRLQKDIGIGREHFQRWPDHPQPGHSRLRYCVLTGSHLARLDEMIEDADEQDATAPAV